MRIASMYSKVMPLLLKSITLLLTSSGTRRARAEDSNLGDAHSMAD
jgi:hypothetical protein